jgi:hypothetical protein
MQAGAEIMKENKGDCTGNWVTFKMTGNAFNQYSTIEI